MALTYRIDETIDLITLTASGQVTAADIKDYLAVSRQDPAFRPGLHRLVVAERVECFPQLPEVREITTRTQAARGTPHVPILCQREPVPCGR